VPAPGVAPRHWVWGSEVTLALLPTSAQYSTQQLYYTLYLGGSSANKRRIMDWWEGGRRHLEALVSHGEGRAWPGLNA